MNKKEVAIKVGLGVAKGLALGCIYTAMFAVAFLREAAKPDKRTRKSKGVMSGPGSYFYR